MLIRVPLFQTLDPTVLESIAAMLKPRFVLPGEKVIRQGERGQEMFFIASGALEVALPRETRHLGSGDFFGELALLSQGPRTADVTAMGYCELLVMTGSDFSQLLVQDRNLELHISNMAKLRLARS